MITYILFFLIILLSNIIQGITGFAGTILAMPPSLMLVGYPVAKPVLNVLGLLSGIYVFAGNHEKVCFEELRKIVAVMAAGIIGGILIKGMFAGKEQVLYRLLGLFVIFLSVRGGLSLKREKGRRESRISSGGNTAAQLLVLVLSGIVHGIFVSGGPLLISYLTKRIEDKVAFRATISTVWIFLNGMILADDIRSGLWTWELMGIQLVSLPFLLAGMFIGGKLYARMSQRLFMVITYMLLFISGISLLLK